jgi:hypothetical protein
MRLEQQLVELARLLGSSGRGSSVTTFATIDCAVGPVNGGSPTSISYVVAPRA